MIEFSIYYPTAKLINEPSKDRVRVEFVLPKRPLLFWVERLVSESLDLPKGYGIAWYVPEKATLLYAPIPFNVVIGFGIWLWHWYRYGAARWLVNHSPRRRDAK